MSNAIEHAVVNQLDTEARNALFVLGNAGHGVDRSANLEMAVADDGLGMTADRLGQVLDSNYRVLSEKGTGIGVGNVNQRLKKIFGPEYGLSISSEQGAGTTVVITLPLASRRKSVC